VADNGWIVSCPPTDVIASRSTPISGELPALSSAVAIELDKDLYELNNFIPNGKINHVLNYGYTYNIESIIIMLTYVYICRLHQTMKVLPLTIFLIVDQWNINWITKFSPHIYNQIFFVKL